MKKLFVFLFLGMIFFLSSCKKSETPNNDNESYYYDAVIGGVAYKETIPFDNTNSDLEAGSSLGGTNDVVFSANISNNGTNGTSMGISKGLFHNYLSTTEAAFKNFFAPGDYNYAPYGDDGVTLGWLDKNGTDWSTEYGTGIQTGSTFKIISITEQRSITGELYIKTTIQFNCKLYDGNGNVKQATGTFVGLFGMI
jgi:hypothetical protein